MLSGAAIIRHHKTWTCQVSSAFDGHRETKASAIRADELSLETSISSPVAVFFYFWLNIHLTLPHAVFIEAESDWPTKYRI